VNTEVGTEGNVLAAIRKVGGVQDTYTVHGVWGIVAKIRTESMGKLKETIANHIEPSDKIQSALTMAAVENLS